MSKQTGKLRSQRIDLNYYRHREGLYWWRLACIGAGIFFGGVYTRFVIVGTLSGVTNNLAATHVSTGFVARPHAHFETDCNACHQDFTPLSNDAVRLSNNAVIQPVLSGLGIDFNSAIQHVHDKCNDCHRVGDHHRDLLGQSAVSLDKNCAGCHVDHQGRSHNLSLVSNEKCTQCHRDILNVLKSDRKTKTVLDVTALTLSGHSAFQSLPSPDRQMLDPGRLVFDHAQHMIAGQPHGKPLVAKKWSSLSKADQTRYIKLNPQRLASRPSDLVQLSCSDCHQREGLPSNAGFSASDSELGRYMKPISFTEHCESCHRMNPPAATSDTLPLPHAASWKEIDKRLAASIIGARATGSMRLNNDDSNPNPVVGTGVQESNRNLVGVSNDEIDAARTLVKAECRKCHGSEFEDENSDSVEAAIAGRQGPMIPARWLKKGIYDHAAHARIDCKYCHDQAYPNGQTFPGQRLDRSQIPHSKSIMIGNIETCIDCHRSTDSATPSTLLGADGRPKELFGGMPTWASADCMQCHRYHSGVTRSSPSEPSPSRSTASAVATETVEAAP